MAVDASSPYSDAYFAAVGAGSLASARTVLREAFGLLGTPASVVDVGCGTGTWLRAALELGARAVFGLDGDWVPRDRLEIPANRFVPCDLAADGDPERAGVSGPFDLVMSLEVAEHLPAARAGGFVETLCGLGDAVLFSAAIPHQGGVDHVNEAWPMAWGALFAARGFECFDALRPRIWLSPAVDWWYAQNALLFARNGAAERLRRASPPSPAAPPLPLVHPRRYLWQADAGATIAGLAAELAEARRDAEAARAEALRLDGAEAAAARAAAEAVALRAEVRALRNSISWRATAPVRRAARLLRREPAGPD